MVCTLEVEDALPEKNTVSPLASKEMNHLWGFHPGFNSLYFGKPSFHESPVHISKKTRSSENIKP